VSVLSKYIHHSIHSLYTKHMAKFRKKIVTPQTHTVGRLDGKQEKEPITKERIQTWIQNTKKLKDFGVLIPAPLAHQDKDHKLALPVVLGKDGQTLADAYTGEGNIPAWDLANLNAGYWEDFDQDADGALVGEVDVPNAEKAEKIGKEIKQTSVLVMPARKIVKDGKEIEVGEHLAHVAMCLHAQEPGQANFEPLDPVPSGLAMSFILAMDDVTGLPDPTKPKDEKLYKVITLLRSALNVAIPEDTTRENFLDSLVLVLTQKLADKQEEQTESGITERPQDAATKSPSIAMSETITPNKSEAILMSILVKDRKKVIKDRINALLSSGRISKDYADKTLFPKLEAFKMSAADIDDSGNFNKSPLEDLIEGLEQAQPLVGPSLLEDAQPGLNDVPLGAEVQSVPVDVITGTGDMNSLSSDQMDDILNEAGL